MGCKSGKKDCLYSGEVMAAGLDEMRDSFLGGMKDWEPLGQQGGYPAEYAAFGCTASECGRVGEMTKGIREAGVDQIGGARRRLRRRRQTRGRRLRRTHTRRRQTRGRNH
jgi:hypothetical protein